MRLLLFILLSILCSVKCSAQGERNNWYFGKNAGITFNMGIPSYLSDGKTRSSEACATLSDKNGNLLFYANGIDTSTSPYANYSTIWNRQHLPMQNSFGIIGNYSMTQGNLILPDPSDSTKFYFFGIQVFGTELYYSTIDLNLDSGRGAVVQKNVLLCDTSITEKMTAVKHANGRDWWLLVHQQVSDNFFEYLITPAGISGPTILPTGSCIGCNDPYSSGQMVFSNDGSKLVVANHEGQLDLYDFDRCSGSISLIHQLGKSSTSNFDYYGCSFSANGMVLYASRFDSLYQFDLSATNIKATRLLLMSVNIANYWIGQHLIGPDNKIYIALGRNNWTTDSLDYYISVINYPDSVGYACDLRPHSFWLGGHRSKGGLPNEPHYELGALVGSVCDTLTGFTEVNTKVKILVYPNPAFNQLAISSSQLANGQEVTVTIYDMLGKVQLQQKVLPQGDFTVDVNALPSGIYMLQLKQADRLFNGRFVKE